MSYATEGRPRYTAADRRAKEAERLAALAARDRRWAEGTFEDMLADMRQLDASPEDELRAFVAERHAALRAEHGIA
jgi:hypothetical protein